MSFDANPDPFDSRKKIKIKSEIDVRIVTEIKKYLCNTKQFNPAFIFYHSFDISYQKYSQEENKASLFKIFAFHCIVSNFNSIDQIVQFPKEIIFKILSSLPIPTTKEFQCRIFEKMNKRNNKIVKEIHENILPLERDYGFLDLLSDKIFGENG